MSEITIANPDALGKPLGQYSQISRVKASELLFIAGQVATDSSGKLVGADDFDGQCRRVFSKIQVAPETQGAQFFRPGQVPNHLRQSPDNAQILAHPPREISPAVSPGAHPPHTPPTLRPPP